MPLCELVVLVSLLPCVEHVEQFSLAFENEIDRIGEGDVVGNRAARSALQRAVCSEREGKISWLRWLPVYSTATV